MPYPHGRPGVRDLTVVWGCNQGGTPWANTQPGGRPSFSRASPTPRRPLWGSHDGTGRAPPGGGGLWGFCWASLWPSPLPGLYRAHVQPGDRPHTIATVPLRRVCRS